MIPNLLNTLAGLALMYGVVVHPTWVENRYLPLGAFAIAILVLAVWARFSDARRWFSSVEIVMAIALGILSTLPMATLPNLTFWGGFWVGAVVATTALWAALFRPKSGPAAAAKAQATDAAKLG